MSLWDIAFFPTPSSVLYNTIAELTQGALAMHLFMSLKRLIIALVIAFPLAIFFALLTQKISIIDYFIDPIVALTFPLPKVAIFPLVMLILGIDDGSKIALIAIGMFYLFYVNTRLAIKEILNSEYSQIQKVFPFKFIDYYWHFILRGSTRGILTGLKLGLNYGLTLVVVSELTAAKNGVGYYIWKSWDQFQIINVYSGVAILSLVGCIFYFSIEKYIDYIHQKIH